MEPYASSDIGLYEIERLKRKREERMEEAHRDYALFKRIKHHKDCTHAQFNNTMWIMSFPCHPDCELPE